MHQDTLTQNLAVLQKEITAAQETCHRVNDEIRLLAVTKGRTAETLRRAYAAGLHAFGENYIQEAEIKIKQLANLNIEWHFLGKLQRNKIRTIATHFDWVQTLTTFEHAEKLHHVRELSQKPLSICIQVNLSGESQKSGLPLDFPLIFALAQKMQQFDRLELRGLMGMGTAGASVAQQHAEFKALRNCYAALIQAGLPLDTLSMGMSDDFVVAIQEGATLLRIGSRIFK